MGETRTTIRQPTRSRRSAVGSAGSNGGEGRPLHDLVGLAHVIIGAIALGGGLLSVMFLESLSLRTVAGPLILLTLAAMCLLAGLWLRDGRRRGAILAAVLDGARLSLLLFSPARFGLDTLVTLGLLVGAIAVLPTLSSTAEP